MEVGSVGGPVNFWAVPFASMALPCGMEPMRKTMSSPDGGLSGGAVVAG